MTIYEQCLHFLVSSSIFKIGVAVTMFTRLWHICWHRKYLIFQPFLHMIPPSSCNQDRIMLLVLESTLVITPEFNDLQRWKGFLWGLSFWSWFCPTPLSPIPFRFCCTHPITWEVVFSSRTLFLTIIQFNFVHGLGRIKIIARNVKAVLSLLVQGEIREMILETCVPLGGLHWSKMGQNHDFLNKRPSQLLFGVPRSWMDWLHRGLGLLILKRIKLALFVCCHFTLAHNA